MQVGALVWLPSVKVWFERGGGKSQYDHAAFLRQLANCLGTISSSLECALDEQECCHGDKFRKVLTQSVAGGSGRVEDTIAQVGFHASLAWLSRTGMAY